MSDPNGWPDPTRPGVPANPERTGPHWIEDRPLNHVACVVWCHVMEQFHDMSQTMTPKGAAKFWRYLGPCHTPQEVAALVAAGQEAMRDACAQWHDRRAATAHMGTGQGARHEWMAAQLRALPLPSSPEALAAIRAEARRGGMETASGIVDRERGDEPCTDHVSRYAAAALKVAADEIRAAAKEVKP